MNRQTFFDYARRAPFGGSLSPEQVQGCEAILGAWTGTDDRQLAYVLATAFHETAGTMAPVREGSTRTRRLTDAQARRVVARYRYGKPDAETGHVYYGRGLVQLTWKRNYAKMGQAFGVDLVNNPDLALDLKLSAKILIEGMTQARTNVCDFTNKCLSDYFNATTDDPEGARRIVNGTDKASLIAGYQKNFLDSLNAARASEASDVKLVGLSESPKLVKDKSAIGGGLLTLAGAGGAATAVKPILEGIANPYAFGAFVLIVLLACVGGYLFLTGRLQSIRRTGV